MKRKQTNRRQALSHDRRAHREPGISRSSKNDKEIIKQKQIQ